MSAAGIAKARRARRRATEPSPTTRRFARRKSYVEGRVSAAAEAVRTRQGPKGATPRDRAKPDISALHSAQPQVEGRVSAAGIAKARRAHRRATEPSPTTRRFARRKPYVEGRVSAAAEVKSEARLCERGAAQARRACPRASDGGRHVDVDNALTLQGGRASPRDRAKPDISALHSAQPQVEGPMRPRA